MEGEEHFELKHTAYQLKIYTSQKDRKVPFRIRPTLYPHPRGACHPERVNVSNEHRLTV